MTPRQSQELEKLFQGLAEFALQVLGTDLYPNGFYVYHPRARSCSVCGLKPFALTILHQSSSTEKDFDGESGECSQCGHRETIFTCACVGWTGGEAGMKPLPFVRSEQPACTCGHRFFWVLICDRLESEKAGGMFDQSVAVGECDRCGRRRAFALDD